MEGKDGRNRIQQNIKRKNNMKKIIFSLILITLLCGCDNLANDKICNEEKNAILVTFTFNGESHEFVQYVSSGPANKAGIALWPG